MSGNNVTFRWLVVILLVILFVSAAAAAVVCLCVNISATEYTDAGDYGDGSELLDVTARSGISRTRYRTARRT